MSRSSDHEAGALQRRVDGDVRDVGHHFLDVVAIEGARHVGLQCGPYQRSEMHLRVHGGRDKVDASRWGRVLPRSAAPPANDFCFRISAKQQPISAHSA